MNITDNEHIMKQSLNWWTIPYWIYIAGNTFFFITLIYPTIILLPLGAQYEDTSLIKHEILVAVLFFLVVLVLWFFITRLSVLKRTHDFTTRRTTILLLKRPAILLFALLGATSFLSLTALLS